MLSTFKIGLMLGLSIIISIGSQNIFVIKQGLRQDHAYLCAFTCFVSDLVLILLGVTGVSTLIIEFPIIKFSLLCFGVLFLTYYGLKAIWRAFKISNAADSLQLERGEKPLSSGLKLVLTGLSFSFLNPQAILDTMVIIGGNANHYEDNFRILFVIGAITASFVWFLGLALSTKFLSHYLTHPKVWRSFELISGMLMLGFALKFLSDLPFS